MQKFISAGALTKVVTAPDPNSKHACISTKGAIFAFSKVVLREDLVSFPAIATGLQHD